MQAFDHYVTAVFVFFSDFFNALLRTVQSFDRADLNRRERAIVVVALNAGQCADEVTVSDHEADTPTGHVVALAHGEELNGDVLSTWHLHDGRSLEAVIDDVGVSQVMNNVDAVLLGKRNEFFKEVEIYALGGRVAREAQNHKFGFRSRFRNSSFEFAEEIDARTHADAADIGTGNDGAVDMDRVARIRDEDRVAAVAGCEH